jgi:hypothetical protein
MGDTGAEGRRCRGSSARGGLPLEESFGERAGLERRSVVAARLRGSLPPRECCDEEYCWLVMDAADEAVAALDGNVPDTLAHRSSFGLLGLFAPAVISDADGPPTAAGKKSACRPGGVRS